MFIQLLQDPQARSVVERSSGTDPSVASKPPTAPHSDPNPPVLSGLGSPRPSFPSKPKRHAVVGEQPFAPSPSVKPPTTHHVGHSPKDTFWTLDGIKKRRLSTAAPAIPGLEESTAEHKPIGDQLGGQEILHSLVSG